MLFEWTQKRMANNPRTIRGVLLRRRERIYRRLYSMSCISRSESCRIVPAGRSRLTQTICMGENQQPDSRSSSIKQAAVFIAPEIVRQRRIETSVAIVLWSAATWRSRELGRGLGVSRFVSTWPFPWPIAERPVFGFFRRVRASRNVSSDMTLSPGKLIATRQYSLGQRMHSWRLPRR
jgi:hypothetical protein